MNPTSTKPTPRFVVVAGIDSSPQAKCVLAAALERVRDKPRADLHIVHVVEADASGLPQLLVEARAFLQSKAEEVAAETTARVRTHLGAGPAWRGIVQLATDTKADLIVVGTHGRTGVAHVVFGSQAERVVRRAPCPVLVARDVTQSAPGVPEIEPPCPDCLHVQESTAGAELWCARHATHHPGAHRHYEYPSSFANGSMFVRPE